MRKQWFCLLAVTMLLLQGYAIGGATASIQRPEPYSDETLESVEELEQVVPPRLKRTPENQALREQVEKSILDYQNTIVQLESDNGVYAPGIDQQLSSLGLALQYLGRHEEAIAVYKRASHLIRINEGLYSLAQTPILDRITNSYIAVAKWDKVTEVYEYYYWLSEQNYGANNIRMLPSMERLSRWHLQAYAMQFGDDMDQVVQHLIDSTVMYEKSLALLSAIHGPNSPELIDTLNGITVTNYFFATFQRAPVERRNDVINSDLDSRRSTQIMNQYIANSFRRGRDALQQQVRVYSHDKNAAPWAVANAKVKLADWLLMFNKRNAAIDEYREAYQLLTNQESNKDQLTMIFGHPVALPNLDMLENNTYGEFDKREQDSSRDYVLASFSVTEQGKTADIEILESQPADNTSVRSRVKKSLRVARFRPRFVAGEPVFSEKVKLWVLSPQH